MKLTSNGVIVTGFIALTGVLLASIGAPHDRKLPVPAVGTAQVASDNTVFAGGFTLTSDTIKLPDDAGAFPAGDHDDLVTARCTACHSASMVLAQPALSADQWKAEVTKMREIYRAPVADAEVGSIVSYLTTMPSQRTGALTGKVQDPDPQARPQIPL